MFQSGQLATKHQKVTNFANLTRNNKPTGVLHIKLKISCLKEGWIHLGVQGGGGARKWGCKGVGVQGGGVQGGGVQGGGVQGVSFFIMKYT